MNQKKPVKRWMRLREIIEVLREGGLFYPMDLKKRDIPYQSAKNGLRLGFHIGVFKQDKDKGPYRWIDYDPEEPIIRKVLERYFPNGINAFFMSKYTVETDLFKEALKEAAIRTGNDPMDQVFRTRFYKIVKKKLGKTAFQQS